MSSQSCQSCHSLHSPHSRVTLQTIALAAGVSRSTVSKALRNDRTIPPGTCQRVQKLATEMGYTPDPAVSSLMAQLRLRRGHKYLEPIAFVTSTPTRDGWKKSSSYRDYFSGAEQRCKELGFQLETFWMGDANWNGERLSQILRTRNIRGILIAPTGSLEMDLGLRWEWFATAAFGYTLKFPPCHRATNHQYRSTLRAFQNLDERGYRRIGLLFPKSYDQWIINNRFAALSVYQSYIPRGSCVPPLMNTKAETRDGCLEWIKKHRVDSIICLEGSIVRWLMEAGLSIPDELGLVQLTAFDESEPGVACIDQNSTFIGATAIDLITEQLYENRLGIPKHQKILLSEGYWRDGWTVRPKIGMTPSIHWRHLL